MALDGANRLIFFGLEGSRSDYRDPSSGGGGGNRTRVRKPYIPGPTCLAVFLILVVHYPSGREDDRPAQERFSEPALSTLDTRACERVPRVWMHKHTPVGG